MFLNLYCWASSSTTADSDYPFEQLEARAEEALKQEKEAAELAELRRQMVPKARPASVLKTVRWVPTLPSALAINLCPSSLSCLNANNQSLGPKWCCALINGPALCVCRRPSSCKSQICRPQKLSRRTYPLVSVGLHEPLVLKLLFSVGREQLLPSSQPRRELPVVHTHSSALLPTNKPSGSWALRGADRFLVRLIDRFLVRLILDVHALLARPFSPWRE